MPRHDHLRALVRVVFVAWLGVAAAAAAEPPMLFKDLAPGPAEDEGSSPGVPVAAGGRIYFEAFDAAHGRELWSSDGDLTAESTSLVRDFCPGSCSGINSERGLDSAELDGALIFSNYQSASFGELLHTQGLWRTRGTAESTTLLVSGRAGSLNRLEDRVVFTLGSSEFEWPTLWVTNGDPAGTRQLGSQPVAWAVIRAEDRIFYFVEVADDEIELWSTDGTPAGTRRVAGSWEPAPHRVTAVGSRLYFLIGDDLWTSTGTPESTRMLHGFVDSDPFEGGEPFPVVGESIFFLVRGAGSVLWTSDGTAAGTRRLRAVCVETSCTLMASNTATANGLLFFIGQDEVHGHEVWVSDGTPEGTLLPRDVSANAFASPPRRLTAAGDVVYFSVDSVRGFDRDLWKSDGSAEGTELVHVGAVPEDLTANGEVLYFANGDYLWKSDGTPGGTAPVTMRRFSRLDILAAIDGHVFFDAGLEDDLWVSDGSDAGTRRLRDFGAALGRPSSPAHFAALGERLFFTATDADASSFIDRDLWVSDGTPEHTAQLFESLEPRRILLFAKAGDRLFFGADRSEELWVSDGTAAGSEPIGRFGQIRAMTASPDRLYFLVGDRLGTSDGTATGTYYVSGAATATGDVLNDVIRFLTVGDLLFFVANSERQFEFGLWRTDGTTAGTVRLADAGVNHFVNAYVETGLTAFQGHLYFSGGCGNELWESDGTASGTSRLVRLGSTGSCNKQIRSLAATARGIFALTVSNRNVVELWYNHGTQGAQRLRALPALPSRWEEESLRFDELPQDLLFAAGEHVYFAVAEPATGLELWASNGQTTGMVKDICPGPCGSVPHRPAAIDGRLFFAASDGASGWEPWVSDGTGAGTRRLADVAPGASSSSPREFFAFGDAVFFQADDSVHGSELWALTLADDCDDDPRTACLLDDRFQVAVRWRAHGAGAAEGDGFAVPFSDETSLFWFFNPANLELAVKLLDGRPINEHFWFFSGGLSDVEYWVDVTDRESGETRTYHNPPGEICGQRDLHAFFGGDAASDAEGALRLRAAPPAAGGKQGSCVAGPRTLCLLDGRFQVEVEWRTADGEGRGMAREGTDETGFFWFFGPDNLELVVKALDGRRINGRFWLFYGALTDVEYSMTVTDTATGAQRVYYNPPGDICGRGDTAAF